MSIGSDKGPARTAGPNVEDSAVTARRRLMSLADHDGHGPDSEFRAEPAMIMISLTVTRTAQACQWAAGKLKHPTLTIVTHPGDGPQTVRVRSVRDDMTVNDMDHCVPNR
jgi:hypothetical protein